MVDIRGKVNKKREEGSDYIATDYEGLKEDYLDAHVPGAVFVDWTKVSQCCMPLLLEVQQSLPPLCIPGYVYSYRRVCYFLGFDAVNVDGDVGKMVWRFLVGVDK